jgi:hypothetical protein
MNINLTIPDTKASQIVDGLCAATGWNAASGKTKAEWVNERISQWVKETAKRGLLKASQLEINTAIDTVAITYDATDLDKGVR